MRLGSVVNGFDYSLKFKGPLDVYELRDNSRPEDLNEVKVIGRSSGKDPWIELARISKGIQHRPILSSGQEQVLSFGENDFAHYSLAL